jgi:uncharacterized protein (TIGR03083 family)
VDLTPEQWQAASSCAGWSVADLVSHVVGNGSTVLTFAQRALGGDPTPAFGPASREVREQIKAGGHVLAAERQTAEARELTDLAAGLSDEEFARIGQHPLGPRTVAWICTSRLAEVVFHHWDLRRSLGDAGAVDRAAAQHLLPFMLDPDYIRLFTARTDAQAPVETFRFTSRPDGATWRVAMSREEARIEPGPGEAATVGVTADPVWLALAVYGRVRVDSGPFTVDGPADSANRFAAYFGG